jgi:LEA14-like dessication related protein
MGRTQRLVYIPSVSRHPESAMRRLAALAAAASLAAGAACASSNTSSGTPSGDPAPPFYRPKVTLGDVRLASAGIGGGAMDVLLKVYNPNDYDLESPRVAYRILVDTLQVASGLYDSDVTLTAGDTTALRVPASFTYRSLGRAGFALTNTGSVNYRVLGNMYVDTPGGRLGFPFDRAGWFSSLGAVRRSR